MKLFSSKKTFLKVLVAVIAFMVFGTTSAYADVNIYGFLVYLPPNNTDGFYEELRLLLPSNVDPSSVSIYINGLSCGNLSQYNYSNPPQTDGNETVYSLNVLNIFSSCVSASGSYGIGNLMSVYIDVPNANLTQVAGVAMAWGNGINKRLPLNIVSGQPSQLVY